MTTPQNSGTPAQQIALSAPYYRASLPVAFMRFWTKYATFSGRASRSEYWWWALIQFVITVVAEIINVSGGSGMKIDAAGNLPAPSFGFATVGVIILLWYLATLVPGIALTVRRFHDANYSGWFILLGLIPIIGGIIILIVTLLGPKALGARFDSQPPVEV